MKVSNTEATKHKRLHGFFIESGQLTTGGGVDVVGMRLLDNHSHPAGLLRALTVCTTLIPRAHYGTFHFPKSPLRWQQNTSALQDAAVPLCDAQIGLLLDQRAAPDALITPQELWSGLYIDSTLERDASATRIVFGVNAADLLKVRSHH